MSHNPTVTALIPTYNAEKTIRRALSSVLEQTLQPIEIIIVDDASTDNTTSVVEEISRELKPDFLKYKLYPQHPIPRIAFLRIKTKWHFSSEHN